MGRAIAVGRIARAHGVRGEVFVERFGDSEGILDPGRTLTARRRGEQETAATVSLTVDRSKPQPKGRWLVFFEGVDDREAAEALQGSILEVDESELPPLEEGRYYRFQLIGLEAVTPDGDTLGVVEEVWDTGANEIYVVRGERGEILLPAIAQVIRELDFEAKRVIVTPLPGLIPEES